MNERRAIVVVLFAVTGLAVMGGCASSRTPQAAFFQTPGALPMGSVPAAATSGSPAVSASQPAVVRGQNPQAADEPNSVFRSGVRLAQYTAPPAGSGFPVGPPPQTVPGAASGSGAPATGPAVGTGISAAPGETIEPLLPGTGLGQPFATPDQPHVDIDPAMSTPVDIMVEETQTGRFMFGAGINSDAGVTGQIVIDERNFDIMRLPTSWRDFAEGTAFRGAGQGFRVEAMPGTQVQRYLVSFTEPYLFDTPISFNLSGFLYDRRFYDWSEQRLGGRMSLGYRLTPDLSVAASLRAENVDITDPRVLIPQLSEVLGDNDLFSGRLTLTNDTRDIPFAPTEGHLIELGVEQAFGSFDFPRADLDLRKYYLVRERPDGSGRHTLGFMFRLGFSGSDTPIFENYFAGGYSTLRGFEFRGASPVDSTVRVGGTFMFLGAAEYVFPLTADDMLKGALFCDFGTVEEDVRLSADTYRVAPGFGVRINVPALGPAPLAFDFAFPVAKADTDDTRVFTFFMGVGR
ncbi:MAG: BamA/TamA family outer membrane protein [Pirellulaceae bacterium]|nr:BamA/TamA family outer membrane protein [Pirellulaceae bacterium]